MGEQNWFEDWFNSHYYHLLYSNRSEQEAENFIKKLIAHLDIPPHSKVLDIACGKGRHARQLASYGHNVTGFDLASESIRLANESRNEHLRFYVHDMRLPFTEDGPFTYAFNFFTSFGYFENDAEDQAAFACFSHALAQKGRLIVDFLNVDYSLNRLVSEEDILRNPITFHIKRSMDGRYFHKSTSFEDDGKSYEFKERVRALRLENFENLCALNGLQIIETFGDYDLNPYDSQNSPRLIFIAEKL
jgi:SAM-dependent methyltransferase